MSTLTKTAIIILLAWLATDPVLVLADPPRHAPAHGWRKKNDPFYVGFTGRHWEQDYGILSGRCNHEAVATVLGGIIGGTIGAKVADRDDRAIAVIIGATAGALIGNRIGRDLDDADRSCIGHAMEIGQTGQQVTWTNESTGVEYELTPGDGREHGGDACREFTLVAASGDTRSKERGLACESDTGVWRIEE